MVGTTLFFKTVGISVVLSLSLSLSAHLFLSLPISFSHAIRNRCSVKCTLTQLCGSDESIYQVHDHEEERDKCEHVLLRDSTRFEKIGTMATLR